MGIFSSVFNKTQIRIVSILVVAVAFSVIPFGQKAFANHESYVYNQRGGSVALRAVPTASSNNPRAWLKNDTKFWMTCYTDHQWFNGNYNSNRWFYGQSQYSGWGYVHSSYVYYQKTVPRC